MQIEQTGKFGRKYTSTFIVLIVMLFVSLLWSMFPKEEERPINAENMTVEQRADIDKTVLLKELEAVGAEKVSLNYSSGIINVYLENRSTDQYVDDKASDAIKLVEDTLVQRESDLTLEKDSYIINVYGKDGFLIK